MFVYWQFVAKNGVDRSSNPVTKLHRSKVHRKDLYLDSRTLCKLKIPKEAQVTRTELCFELPEELARCVVCERKA